MLEGFVDQAKAAAAALVEKHLARVSAAVPSPDCSTEGEGSPRPDEDMREAA